jgi:hypothetical protein
MKLSILLGLCVLALLAVPASVSAGAMTAFSGTIPSGTTITVTPDSIGLGTITPPYVYEGLEVNVTVLTYDSLSWALKAEDTSGSPSKGFMYSSSPTARTLTNPFQIYDYTLSTPAYQPLGTDQYTWYSGTGTGSTDVKSFFKQEITRNDLSGAYAITVTFTWVSA